MYDFNDGGAFVLILIFLVIAIVPAVFYLLTLQKTLQAISPENRKMPPANVWLMFIPLFNLVWHFIVVAAIADSIKAEAARKYIVLEEDRPAYGIGLAMCILHCCCVIPILKSFAALGLLVCWIIYWVKVAKYKDQIINANFSYNEYPQPEDLIK